MSQGPENGTRQSAIPRCCHTPNLGFIPEITKEMCTGHNAEGMDSAISIYAPPKFLWRHRECRGSVVECMTQDREAADSSLTNGTVLWCLSKTHLS